MSNKHKSLAKNQTGLVSFVVVIIIMFVLSLIVLAFARLVRREQTQTLDRQLNTQAFYAAESGVNDALNALASPTPPTGFNDECTGTNSFMDRAGLSGDLGNGVAYSCLLVDDTLEYLTYDSVSDVSTVIPLRAEGNVPIDTLRVAWDDTLTGSPVLTGCPAEGSFPAGWNNAGCQVGMLRLELVPFGLTPVGRDTLITGRGIAFLQPGNSGRLSESFSIMTGPNGNSQGQPMRVNCNGSGLRRCSLEIRNIGTRLGYLRLRSLYRTSGVTISALSGGSPVDLVGAQVEIDVTGRVSSVLKRIKVAAPIPLGDPGSPLPEYALQTTRTQCKRMIWRPGSARPDWLPGTDNDYCNPLLP